MDELVAMMFDIDELRNVISAAKATKSDKVQQSLSQALNGGRLCVSSSKYGLIASVSLSIDRAVISEIADELYSLGCCGFAETIYDDIVEHDYIKQDQNPQTSSTEHIL